MSSRQTGHCKGRLRGAAQPLPALPQFADCGNRLVDNLLRNQSANVR